MKAPPPPPPCELRIALASRHVELVRGFVREAALAEGIAHTSASLIAMDCAAAWQALSNISQDGHARVIACFPRETVSIRMILVGHVQFATAIASLKDRLPVGAGLSFRESGIDGWEVTLERGLVDREEAHVAEITSPEVAAPQSGDITIDLAREADAPAIARCFLAVYGHHYVHPYVFSPHRYWARVEAGELIPVVARDARGEVIGHVALEREAGAMVAERGEAVVLPSARGQHLLERMTDRLSEEAPRHGLHGVYAEPLTIHTFSQRNDVRAGMPVCAVLLGANPEGFRPKGIPCPTAGQRQSYLRTFRFVTSPGTRKLEAPAPYRDILLKLYASLGVTPVVAPPSEPRLRDSRTSLSVNDRGYGVIRFEQIGSSCAVELAQALRDVRSLGARSIQLSGRASDPGLPLLGDAARRLGFFFCGLGPGFATGDDLVLLQMLSEPLDTGKLQLFTDEAKQLVAYIEADRQSVGLDGPSAP